jgi:hypothetical protein
MRWWLAMVIGVALAAPAAAQPRFGGRLGARPATVPQGTVPRDLPEGVSARGTLIHFLLLEQPSVQQELRVTPEQVQKAQQLAAAHRQQLQGLGSLPREDAARKVLEIQQSAERDLQALLSPGQLQRLKEIGLQQLGPMALSRPDVAEAVGLTAEQKQQIRSLQEQFARTALQSAQGLQSLRGGGRPRLRELKSTIGAVQDNLARIEAAKRDTDARILALLTSEQRQKWEQAKGAPFQGALNLGPAGRLLGP